MSDFFRKAQAQQREQPEPSEGGRPIPRLVIASVALLFVWAIAYIAITHQSLPADYGDRRTAADFQVMAGAQGALDGGQLYTAQCLACHQAQGEGLPGVFPPLAGSEWVTGKGALAIQIVLHGITGSITVKGNTYTGEMPAFKDKLGDDEIAALLTYIRSHFGNSADALTAADVSAAREASAAQVLPWAGEAALADYH